MQKKDFIDKIAQSNGKEKWDVMLDFSRFLRQASPQESIQQSKAVLKAAREEGDHVFVINALTYLATTYIYISDSKQAEYWLEELRKEGEKQNNNKVLGDYYNMRGRLFFQQNDAASALDLLLKALDYYLKTDSPTDKLSCYNALGIIHLEMQEKETAKQYLRLALDIAEKYDNPAEYSIRVNLSTILYNEEEYSEAIEINRKSLQFYRQNNMKEQEATTLGNIGLCYFQLGKYDEALSSFLKSKNLYEESNNQRKVASSAKSIADLYLQQNMYQEAKSYIDEALKIAEENEYKFDLASIYDSCADYYEATGDYKTACNFLRKKHNKFKEVNIENQSKELKELEEKYKTRIYKLKTEELEKSNQAMTNQINELNQALSKLQLSNKKLQEKFQKTARQINEKDNLIFSQSRMAIMGKMLSYVAHQWKQPLNIIWILTQATLDAWQFGEINDDFITNQTKNIGEQINYMSQTINDFRDFFKEEYQENFEVVKVINKTEKILSYSIKQSAIEIHKDISEGCTLTGNPNELMQVLINILNNARQAVEESNPPRRIIKMSLKCSKEKLIISIFNYGKHIPEKNLPKLFQPYFTTKGEAGTGIGLNISQHLIKNKFNGIISAHNLKSGVDFRISVDL